MIYSEFLLAQCLSSIWVFCHQSQGAPSPEMLHRPTSPHCWLDMDETAFLSNPSGTVVKKRKIMCFGVGDVNEKGENFSFAFSTDSFLYFSFIAVQSTEASLTCSHAQHQLCFILFGSVPVHPGVS